MSGETWVQPVTLKGRVVRLEPLTMEHSPHLREVADMSLFPYAVLLPEGLDEESFNRYIERSLAVEGRVPFAIVLQETGRAIGTSSYLEIRPAHRGLEIGYTWIAKPYQGTQVNPESKYLMLRHAIEELGAIRVQLKTDSRNIQSQRAMTKLGAKFEGILRKQMVLPDGYERHSAMFSITDDEWPGVKAQLEERLGYVPGQ